MAQSVGPLNDDDKDLRGIWLEQHGQFDPGGPYTSSTFGELVTEQATQLGVRNFVGEEGPEWKAAVVTVQYQCGGETWMVQYAGEAYRGLTLDKANGKVRGAFRM